MKCSCSVAGCCRLCVSVALLGGLGLLISWFGVGLFIIYCLVTWCGFVLGLWVCRLCGLMQVVGFVGVWGWVWCGYLLCVVGFGFGVSGLWVSLMLIVTGLVVFDLARVGFLLYFGC